MFSKTIALFSITTSLLGGFVIESQSTPEPMNTFAASVGMTPAA